LTAKSALTLYSSNLAYSFWGNATNNSSNDKRSSETYQLGARTHYKPMQDKLFIPLANLWLVVI
ncbi:MAG: hypothetical protein RAM38_12450, partial [Arsenophonus sp.]|nr:hypothetical protein [Arsenophonus sp.]MDR5615005.1 hypothetical protein [Arsenophonus sp.]